MSQLLIEIDSPEDEALLLKLLPKLNARVVNCSVPAPRVNQSPVDVLERIAARGGTTSFGDPSVWQRETGTDRSLPGREE